MNDGSNKDDNNDTGKKTAPPFLLLEEEARMTWEIGKAVLMQTTDENKVVSALRRSQRRITSKN